MRIFYSKYLLLFQVLLVCLCISAAVQSDDVRMTPTVCAVRQSLPWVVSIGTQNLVRVDDGYDTFFHEFYGHVRRRREKVVSSYVPLGSGLIISSRGLVITNLHVVRRANNLEVHLWDGSSLNARIVGFDSPNDLCILQITDSLPEGGLQEVRLGLPDDVMLGETVITIGNPFGLDHSVSQGVLSALNRSYADDEYPFDDILQTDAAINPGNSGGPLINLRGEVIGINQAIRQGASGIGFAIPAKRIEQFVTHWLLPYRFSDSWLGLDGDQQLEWRDGVVLKGVISGGPASSSGLKNGDVVVAVDGKKLTRLLDFSRLVWFHKKGEQLEFTLSDGRYVKVEVKRMGDEDLICRRLGINVQNLTPELCEAVDLPRNSRGVVINQLYPEGDFVNEEATWKNKLKRGDIIIRVDDEDVRTSSDLARLLRKRKCGDAVTLLACVFDGRMSRVSLVQIKVLLK